LTEREGGGGRVALRHGSGGPAMRDLVGSLVGAHLRDDGDRIALGAMDDGAALRFGPRWLVFTTDGHVVKPPFFPGGDIGRLAVAGTVNDLAVMGATEVLGIAVGLVLEEGFPREALERVQASMDETCREAGTLILTGDTKVMGRGELDGIVISTSGIGLADRPVRDNGLRPGDEILVTGSLADHGLAVLAARHDLGLAGELRSDVAPLNGLLRAALAAGGPAIVAMKDPTRGGVASALHEMAAKSGVEVWLDEAALPLRPAARAAAELLGVDPLHVASEGRALLGVRPGEAQAVLTALRAHPLGRDACRIGRCAEGAAGRVVLDTGLGRRLVTEVEGEVLPRIC
jgi:hydrogenase expression/formation protein HypE